MDISPEKPEPALGTPSRPWRDVWYQDRQGQPASLRDLQAGGGGEQPFRVDQAGDVVLDPDRVLPQQAPRPIPGDDLLYLKKPYEGPDLPGVGENALDNLYSRVWRDTSDGRVYLVTRISYLYFQVELTRQDRS